MVFTPKVTKTAERWKRDSNLPDVKYNVDGRLHLTDLARDITEKLPVTKFKDRVEFEDVAGKIFSQVWPKWEEYFGPFVRKPFGRDVLRSVFRHAKIELGDAKHDS